MMQSSSSPLKQPRLISPLQRPTFKTNKAIISAAGPADANSSHRFSEEMQAQEMIYINSACALWAAASVWKGGRRDIWN
jgi:hypothetical protein